MAVKVLVKAEDLFQVGEDKRVELVKGEIVEMSPTGMEHGAIVVNLAMLIGGYVHANGLGRVYAGEPGVILERDPDTVRAPDLMFIAASRLPAQGTPAGFGDVVPDLAVEVVSPNDRWSEIEEKVDDYLAAGVRMIWVVNPKTRSVHVYRPSSDARRILESDTLQGEEVLSGFAVPAKDLFK
ncbi:MAG TPA: Uma2 family endonuclease [Anaerolineae bacterium]|nr:Uma2 family endonuclease [Anaerolineae bacterium]